MHNDVKLQLLLRSSRFFHSLNRRFARHMRRFSAQIHATLALRVTSCHYTIYAVVTIWLLLALGSLYAQYGAISHASNIIITLSFVFANSHVYLTVHHDIQPFVISDIPIHAFRLHSASHVKYEVYSCEKHNFLLWLGNVRRRPIHLSLFYSRQSRYDVRNDAKLLRPTHMTIFALTTSPLTFTPVDKHLSSVRHETLPPFKKPPTTDGRISAKAFHPHSLCARSLLRRIRYMALQSCLFAIRRTQGT